MKVVLFCGGHGDAAARLLRPDPEAAGRRRAAPDHVAPDEVLRALRPQGLHPLPRATAANGSRSYFLRYDECASNDFVLADGGRHVELLRTRHRRLADHVRRHRPRRRTSASACAGSAPHVEDDDGVPRQLRRRPVGPPARRLRRLLPSRATRSRTLPQRAAPAHVPHRRTPTPDDYVTQPRAGRRGRRAADQRRVLRLPPRRSSTTCTQAKSWSSSRSTG